MAGFWAWFASPALGRVFAILLLVVSVAVIGIYGRRGDLRRLELSLPLLITLLVGLLFTGVAFLQGGIAGEAWRTVQLRYWLAGDNEIPFVFAQRVAAHESLHGYLIDDWQSSDRPPLQTGLVPLQWPFWNNKGTAYQLLSSALLNAWLPAMWVVLRVRGLSVRRTLVVVLSTAATGAIFFNVIYVWPKMLAGALALAAFAILVSRLPADRWRGAGVLVACLATLSLLAHGGAGFAILALAPFAYLFRRRITLAAIAACAEVGLVLYIPWSFYQRFVNPPGNRLLKWRLAGVIPIDKRGVVQTVIQQYQSLSLQEIAANKWGNLVSVVANPQLWRTVSATPGWYGFAGMARVAQINDMVLAAGPLLLGALVFFIPSARRSLAQFKPLAVFVGLGVIVWVVVLFGGPATTAAIQNGPYVTVVLFIGLCALCVAALPKIIAYAVFAANLAWFIISWVPGLGFHPALAGSPGSTDIAMVCVCVVALAALAVVCYIAVVRPPVTGESDNGDARESRSTTRVAVR